MRRAITVIVCLVVGLATFAGSGYSPTFYYTLTTTGLTATTITSTTINNSGTITTPGLIDTVTLGTELAPSMAVANWSYTAGEWVFTGSNSAAHQAGVGANTLSPATPLTIVANQTYRVVITVTGASAGTITVSLGGTTGIVSAATGALTYDIIATNTNNLVITPALAYNGTITNCSVKTVAYTGEYSNYSGEYASTPTSEAFGYHALNTKKGLWSTAFGSGALALNGYNDPSMGNGNSAFGYAAIGDGKGGYNNSAFGVSALRYTSTGTFNAAFGTIALNLNTTGNYNSAFGGYDTCEANIDGDHNNGFGYGALKLNDHGDNNCAFGSNALLNTTGSNNVAFGYAAGDNLTTGSGNIIIGASIDAQGATASNQLNIGGVIKATGINTPTTAAISLTGPTSAPYFIDTTTYRADAPRPYGWPYGVNANTLDKEFNSGSSGLTWLAIGGAGGTMTDSLTAYPGYCTVSAAGGALKNFGRAAILNPTWSDEFDIVIKIAAPITLTSSIGLAIADANGKNGKAITVGHNASSYVSAAWAWTTAGNVWDTLAYVASPSDYTFTPYLRLSRVHGSGNVVASCSIDGIGWTKITIWSATTTAYAYYAIYVDMPAQTVPENGQMAVDFIRVR